MRESIEILPGKGFGRWTVLGPCKKAGKEQMWLCRCACGTERYVARRSLLSGYSTSCGCLRKETLNNVLAHDLTGKTFGDLQIIKKDNLTKANGVHWLCRCTCGREVTVAATLLHTGKKTHCGCKTKRGQISDITGRRFGRLTALEATDQRDTKGSVLWRCLCDCGTEVNYSYNTLLYTQIKSCGCRKREHEKGLYGYLTHVDGTSLDMLKSKKTPSNNTTGVRGVFKAGNKYGAKITFQKKTYYLGHYETIEEATDARKRAEAALNDRVVAFYEAWKLRAQENPIWAEENPVRIHVEKQGKELLVECLPELNIASCQVSHRVKSIP